MDATTKTNNDIPLVGITNEAWMATLKGGARTANATLRAQIHRAAASSANEIAQHASGLIRTLNEAVERLQAASTTKEARSAVAWLRCDTWDRMQQAIARLDALTTVLD